MTPRRFPVRGNFDWSFRLRYAHAEANVRRGTSFERGGRLLEELIECRLRGWKHRRSQMVSRY